MADKKISALPAATTPLTGTEILPIVQGGTTDQVTVANLTAGRAVSAAQLTASSGNVTIGTAGMGVNFSANANAPGMTSELLNWYEEGTFTPTFTGLTVGNGSVFGFYRRIGKQVFITYGFILGSTSAVGSLSGVSGLPFTTGSVGVGRFFPVTGAAFKSGVGWFGAWSVLFTSATSGNGIYSSTNNTVLSATVPFTWATDDSLSLTATYFVD